MFSDSRGATLEAESKPGFDSIERRFTLFMLRQWQGWDCEWEKNYLNYFENK